MKVAVVYDTNTPYTTGVYFDRAFRRLGFWVDAYHHDQINSIPDEYKLIFICDSGPTYDIPRFKNGVTMYYAIDVHLDFANRFKMAKTANIPLMAQLSCGAAEANMLGLPVKFVPLGCDPEIHKDHQVERDLDVAFVGHLYEDDAWRTTIKQKLEDRGYKVFVGEATKEEMGEIYSRAKVVLNHTVRDNKKDINMRVFEAMSSGAYLLTQKLDNDDMDAVIAPNLYTSYTDEEDMWNKLNDILSNWTMHHDIAQKGKLFIRSTHTYDIHLSMLMNKIGEENANRKD